jgi:hypothetical protein
VYAETFYVRLFICLFNDSCSGVKFTEDCFSGYLMISVVLYRLCSLHKIDFQVI